MRIFLAIKRVNSSPPDFTVTSRVEIVSAGKVANIPPQFGPAILLINTTLLIRTPLNSAFDHIGLLVIFLGICFVSIVMFLTTHAIERTIKTSHASTDVTRFEGAAIEATTAHVRSRLFLR